MHTDLVRFEPYIEVWDVKKVPVKKAVKQEKKK
jgi:hypothetical protein